MDLLTTIEIEAIKLSLKISFWALLWSLPLALGTAWILARHHFPGKFIFDGIIHLPLVLPPVVIGYVLLVLMGKKGLIGSLLYEELGANFTTYHPLEKFDLRTIVPTENDTYYRNQLLRGYVHDPGAAMQNGIGGHAGVFSNANDLAKLMQMYLNGGVYAEKRYIEQKTIEEFTSCQYCRKDNRRGIGFDKPVIDDSDGPTCEQASSSSFGHSGFTGTIVWADPEHELIYVFLSNRIHPSADNFLLLKENVRTRIQEVIYRAIE